MLSKSTQRYFESFKEKVDEVYEFSNKARSLGFDPVDSVEIPTALSMAEKVVGLISTIYPQVMNSGIAERILEFEKEYGKLSSVVSFKIADEISSEKFCKFNDNLEAIDCAIRIGFAYITLGVVSSPIEGFTGIKVGKRRDGKDYLVASFSGPIRSAGTTASCMVLFLIDFLREKFGFYKYDPTEDEVKRTYTELFDFNERVANLQYMPTEEEALFIAKNIPFQIAGDPSEKIEVSNYKNLERISTNNLRSGFCLVLAEGLAQKAPKGWRLYSEVKKSGIIGTGFDWIEDYLKIHEKVLGGKSDEDSTPVYMKDLVAGRPLFGKPGASGGFRFRYGRSRNSGFSSVCIHPMTMKITNDFLAIGSQLKIEKPSKGCVVTSCDSIEGPIVKLNNNSVVKIEKEIDFEKIKDDIVEIIYLGDILFPFSDVLNRNSKLIKSAYVEEWWVKELENVSSEKLDNIDFWNLSLEKAIELSRKYEIPLHPKYIFYWNEISNKEFLNLLNWFKVGRREDGKGLTLPLKMEYAKGKRALELLGVLHRVEKGLVYVDEIHTSSLFHNFGIYSNLDEIEIDKYDLEKSVLEIVNINSLFRIKDKSGEFIGARMGRPEKAKLRKIQGSPNSLFSLGSSGGRMKTFKSALEKGVVKSDFPNYFCDICDSYSVFKKCDKCGGKTELKEVEDNYGRFKKFSEREIDFNKHFNLALEKLKLKDGAFLDSIKGVEKNFSGDKIQEKLEKGILRSKYNLNVNKDGTIRMDGTELPLVSFKPEEIGTSVEKLKELGYVKDVNGDDLVNENQMLELMPHDVLIPASSSSPDEKGDSVFIKICNFVDDLLVNLYGLDPYYNVKTREDLVGHLGICMAPHNCAGVACRFIGFSNTLGIMASPYMHAAIRRDCDGDEMAIMLLGDVLLNFSKKYLPNRRGSTQDAPLVLNVKIDAGEVDDQILDFEYCDSYPLDLYEKSLEGKHSSEVNVNTVKDILKRGDDPFGGYGFTHPVSNFNTGVFCSAYKLLEDMLKKVDGQMDLAQKLRSVDIDDVARLVIEKHFVKDIKGNLRKFSQQTFRCSNCNHIHRRPPISGKCYNCGQEKLIFTVHEGGIKKYLKPALNLGEKYNISPYLQQVLDLVNGYIESIFGVPEQKGLDKWM